MMAAMAASVWSPVTTISPLTTSARASSSSSSASSPPLTRAALSPAARRRGLSLQWGQRTPQRQQQHRVVSPVLAEAAATETAPSLSPSSSSSTPVLPFRVGHGFDLHRLEPGRKLIIGGVDIPHDRGCDAHSDGDVLMHCIVDALLGALGLPDIGQLFPDNDPKWKGAASSVRRMTEAGYAIGNLDATIILQRPKLSPHKPVIIKNICELLGVPASVVNLKAKTHENVDSLGENRSVACHTVVLLMKT
eukprot:jgi/Chlat1/1836/Chrsp14S00779